MADDNKPKLDAGELPKTFKGKVVLGLAMRARMLDGSLGVRGPKADQIYSDRTPFIESDIVNE